MDKINTLSFGDWVRRRRRALDLTQAELGARVGASAAIVPRSKPMSEGHRELAELLAAALGVPAADREGFLPTLPATLPRWKTYGSPNS